MPAPRPAEHDVAIRGGGAVGLAAALALSRLGLRVALLAEPVAARSDDLRTYALNAASVRLLEALKVWPALPEDARTAVFDMAVEGDGGARLRFSAWQQGVAQLAWIVDAAELERALAAAVRFAPHVSWRPATGEDTAPLLVVAEGRDSATRERLGAAMPLSGYGQRAVAARLVAGQPHAGLALQWFRSPDVLALLPFDRPERGRSYGLVWSVPDARADELMALSDEAFGHAVTDATGGAAGALEPASPRAAWPLALGRAEPACGEGWVLIGDAAHRVHPLAGQGLNLGLADVASLARVIAEREPWRCLGDEKLLRRHARARLVDTLAMGGVTDGLLHLFASPSPLVKEIRNRGLGLVDRLAPLKRLLTTRAVGA